MINRGDLKHKAKSQLKERYWNYLGVSLIPSLVSYIISIPISLIAQGLILTGVISAVTIDNASGDLFRDIVERYSVMDFEGIFDLIESNPDPFVLIKGFMPGYAFLMISEILISVLVMAPIVVGITRWFIRSRETAKVKVNICFSSFKGSVYFKTVGSMLYYNIWLILWFMLFYIPGIIKSYSYRMIPYILADNPEIGAKRALKLSNQMTRGHKFEIFILDLSFIGWYLLGLMACCIGVVAVTPYVNATMAELYDTLKKEAVESGACTMEELGYVPVVQDSGAGDHE